MLDNLYWEEFYNKGYKTAPGLKIQPLNCPFSENMAATKPCPVEPADRNVMYENRILGLPRLRMVWALLDILHESIAIILNYKA